MQRISTFLEQSKLQYFSTIGLNLKPKVRPFQWMFEADGKLWYCTGNQKAVYKELKANPYFELCASVGMTWMRISGEVIFEDNIAIKQLIMDESPLVKSIYKSADNPQLEVFYLSNAIATITEIGKPPTIIKLMSLS